MSSKPLSLNKLGFGLMAPVTPMLPIAAQVNLKSGYLHLQFDGGAYLSTTLRSTFAPSRVEQVSAALKAQSQEPSYSGSGSQYVKLTIQPVSESICCLMAGEVAICKVLIDPQAELVSSDEPIGTQIQ